jgi:site-specific DNA-adenine methylase
MVWWQQRFLLIPLGIKIEAVKGKIRSNHNQRRNAQNQNENQKSEPDYYYSTENHKKGDREYLAYFGLIDSVQFLGIFRFQHKFVFPLIVGNYDHNKILQKAEESSDQKI